jgi:hypothetical protein
MAITVRSNVERNLREAVVLLIRSSDPPERLAPALAAAAAEIRVTGGDWQSAPNLVPGMINGPSFVSDPLPIPGAYIIEIDFASTPTRSRRAVPTILVRHLEEAHIIEAEIRLAPQMSSRRFAFLESLTPAAQAWLLDRASRQGTRRLQPWLTSLTLDWLHARWRDEMTLLALVGATEVPLGWESARPAVDGFLTAGGFPVVLASDFSTGAVTVNLGVFYGLGATLNVARAGWSAARTGEEMRAHRETIRALADAPELRWAGVTTDLNVYETLMQAHARDELGLEPMWYQILSQEQLARLGGPPPGSVMLPGGRVELTVGEPEQWLPRHPDRLAIGSQAARLLGIP